MSVSIATPPKREQFQPLAKVTTLSELFEHPDFRKRIEAAIPKHMSGERMLRTMALSVQKTPKLAKVSALSLMGAFISVAALGLEPNTPLGHAHLIPFDAKKWDRATRQRLVIRTDVNLIIGYQGYADLIYRSDRVRDFECNVVWAGDEFDYEYGTNKHLHHKRGKRARDPEAVPEYAYMFTRLANGGENFEVLTRADVETARGRSQAYRNAMSALDEAKAAGKDPMRNPAYAETPWIKDPIPMWRKTALRAGQKWLPKSIELASAIALDEAGDRNAVDFGKVLEGSAVTEGAWEVEEAEIGGDSGSAFGLREMEDQQVGLAARTAVPEKADGQPTQPPIELSGGAHALFDAWGDTVEWYAEERAWLDAYKRLHGSARDPEEQDALAGHNGDGLAWAGKTMVPETKASSRAKRSAPEKAAEGAPPKSASDPDPDRDRATRMIADLDGLAPEDVHALAANTGIKTVLDRWEHARPELAAEVKAAFNKAAGEDRC